MILFKKFSLRVIIKENFGKLDHTRLRTLFLNPLPQKRKTIKQTKKQLRNEKKGKLQKGKRYLYHKTNKTQNLWQILQINMIDNNTMDKNPK